jgi:hypothetical protein
MDLGVAAIVASITIPLAGYLVAIAKQKNNNENQDHGRSNIVCSLHSGVEENIKIILMQQTEMREDIKTLLSK